MAASRDALRTFKKTDFPVSNIRRFLEPGPIVLVSSAWKGERNIMSMGWHMVMEFSPSLIGCFITSANHSFDMIRRSKECVINIPTVDLAAKVVGIGNSSGRDVDKFAKFRLPFRPSAVRQRLLQLAVERRDEVQHPRLRLAPLACRERGVELAERVPGDGDERLGLVLVQQTTMSPARVLTASIPFSLRGPVAGSAIRPGPLRP